VKGKLTDFKREAADLLDPATLDHSMGDVWDIR